MTRRAAIALAVVALAAAVFLAATGTVDVLHAVLLAAVVVVVAAAWRRAEPGQEVRWPPLPDEDRPGARPDVSELSWSTFSRDGTVGLRVTARIRTLAVARLAAHGVDAADPAQFDRARRLLGDRVAHGLASDRPPTGREAHAWLDAIDRLSPPDERSAR
jgi:hypothetical protein